MVTFVCAQCGSALKKNQVEKHTFQCRSGSFSCIDCNKDFIGDEYVGHTKCISEIERYSAKGWKPPANHNKGEKKQDEWVSIVQATLDKHSKSISPASRNLLHAVAKHDNVPRKKPKFINFINNISRQGFNQATVNEVWDILETEWKAAKQPAAAAVTPAEQLEPAKVDDDEPVKPEKRKKKRKNLESETSQTTNVVEEVVVTETTEDTDCENVQKKKKKRKNKDAVSEETVESIPACMENAEDEVVPKKKKKRKIVLE